MKRSLPALALALASGACFDLDGFVWNPVHCSVADPASETCTGRDICSTCEAPYDFTPFGIPADAVEQITVESGSETVDSYFISSSGLRPEVTLVYAHGNFGGLEHYLNRVGLAYATGANVYAIDYRGFGKSSTAAEPTEVEFMADVAAQRAALDKALLARDLPLDRIALLGYSAGALATVEMARNSPACALVVEAPWPSVQAFTDDSTFSAVPGSFITSGSWDNIAKMPSINVPLLHVHGLADDFVRFEVSEPLFVAANEPKELVTVPGAGHGNGGDDVPTVLGDKYTELVANFLDAHCAP